MSTTSGSLVITSKPRYKYGFHSASMWVVSYSIVMMPGGEWNRVPARGVIPIGALSQINKNTFLFLTKQHTTITFIYVSKRIT
jgi:hypothetical protein